MSISFTCAQSGIDSPKYIRIQNNSVRRSSGNIVVIRIIDGDTVVVRNCDLHMILSIGFACAVNVRAFST